MNSLSSDMLTFKNITENELSGSTFYHEEIDMLLPDMRSLSHDSSIGLFEFLGFPKGLFGSILVTFGCLLGALWGPFGSLWVPFGSLWVPFWTTLGSLWWSLAPLGHDFGDFGIILDQKVTKRGVRCFFFVKLLIYYVSLDEKRTIRVVLTKCFPQNQL